MAANPPSRPAAAAVYSFPHHRLRLTGTDPARTPLVLVACGSFSPITYLHLRMFEMAADHIKANNPEFELIGGYLSPVSDYYKKAGLASSAHRLRMCELAVETNRWLLVDPWEDAQSEYMPTAKVLDHFEHEINEVLGGAERPDGTRVPVRIALLAGADLIQTMSTPDVWSEKDLNHILGKYGSFILERTGTDIEDALSSLQPYKDNIFVIPQFITNDVSSTKIRLFLKRGMSVQYLIPASVIEYIKEHDLYSEEDEASSTGKSKSVESPGQGASSAAGPASKS